MAANPKQAFVTDLTAATRDAVDVLRRCEALAQDYADLGYINNEAGDQLAPFVDLTWEKVDDALGALLAVSTVLNADDGAHRKALKALAQYAK